MSLTPLHLGPGLFLGVLTLRFFNFWAILLGSLVIDIEPAILLTINILNKCYGCPDHNFFHSILGAILGSLILATILLRLREKLDKISLKFRIQQSFSFPVLFSSALAAWLIHIFFDSLTHFDVFPLWPLKSNPILIGPEIYWPLNLILLIFGILGVFIAYKKFKK